MCLEIGAPKWNIINVELTEVRWGVGRRVVREEESKKLDPRGRRGQVALNLVDQAQG